MSRIVIGLTGGIGSGKSTVAAYLRGRGIPVLDADLYSKEALEPNGACYADVVALFGEDILDPFGRIIREKVAKAVFSDEQKRKQLNGIVHPYVLACLGRDTEPHTGAVVWEVPLLFESGFDRCCDEVWTVTAREETRIRRIVERDRCSEEAARARIRAQASDAERIARADAVLENENDVDGIYREVDALLRARRILS